MMLFFKLVISILFLTLLGTLFISVLHAVRAKTDPSLFEKEISQHRIWVGKAFWLMISAVVLTEFMVRFKGGIENPHSLYIHLSFAIPFALMLGMLRFWVTGDRFARVHRPLAYTCLGFYIGTVITGFSLLFRI